MQRVNEYRFYELGKRIAAISAVEYATPYADVMWALWEARDALTQLHADPVGMRVSLPVVARLIGAITKIVPEDVREAAKKSQVLEGQPPVQIGYAYYELQDALKSFEPVLSAECNALDTYVVSQKRAYSTSHLVDRCEEMLPQETVVLLTPGMVDDLRAAGRCLAFDTPTAAGFHILRAVEAMMAVYYKHITGNELPKQNRNWGLYLQKLEKAPKADDKILGALKHIKDNYRNPITHPEDTLTEGEAVMLFALCLSAIEMMAEPLRSTSPALSQLEELKALTEIAEESAESQTDDF